MDKYLFNILDKIKNGVVLLDDNLEVIFWNDSMRNIVDFKQENILYKNIFTIFPNLDREYFKNTFHNTIIRGNQYFFSSKIHKNIISGKSNVNFEINRVKYYNRNYLLMEFEDITNDFIRVKQLKEYLNELSFLNKELKSKEIEIEKLIYQDQLTNVGNRTAFYSFSEKLIANTERNNGIFGLMFIDIDNFKSINDSYGHCAGDKALIKVADTLTKSIRKSDMLFRFGGDEFLILLPNLSNTDSYKATADRIKSSNPKVKIREGVEINISLSIGISFYPSDGNLIDKLMLKADEAMYRIKKAGGSNYACYVQK